MAPVARRIRFLRGEDTQETFAKRMGISRSALANYETGRSTPDSFALSKIAKACGIPEDYFTSSHDPLEANHSLAATVGAVVEGGPDWTEDEATFVRMLRLSDQGTIRAVIGMMLDGVADREVTVQLRTIYSINEDLQRLVEVQSRKREFSKGPLATYPESSPLHRIGFQLKSGKHPQ